MQCSTLRTHKPFSYIHRPALRFRAMAPNTASFAPIHPRRWTPQRQQVFLTALYATRSVAAAARAAGMSRQSVYRLLDRKRGQAFAQAWAHALDWRSLPPPLPLPGPGRVTQGDAG